MFRLKKLVHSFANMLLFFIITSCSSAPPIETPTPIQTKATQTQQPISTAATNTLPRLKIVGNEILNEHDEKVVLRGVAVVDPHMLYWRGELKEYDFKYLSDIWGVDIVRVPFHPDFWQNVPFYMEVYLDNIVEWGEKYGIYIFLGYHAHGNPINNEVEQTQFGNVNPWFGNPYNPDFDLAKEALSSVAERYKDKHHVLYGTFNEPSHITWDKWRPVAEELVDTIQKINPEALIFVSGVNWSSDLRGAINNPVNRENIIYEIHTYPEIEYDDWQSTLLELSKDAPVFLGEWGFTLGSSEGEHSHSVLTLEEYAIPLMQFARENQIGWTAWVFDSVWEPKLLNTRDLYEPSTFGHFVLEQLKQ